MGDMRRTARASFVLDALEQALHERRPVHRDGLVRHSNRGSQYAGIRHTERLAEAGIEPSVGSVGDSSDNALADRSTANAAGLKLNGLRANQLPLCAYQDCVIRRRCGPR